MYLVAICSALIMAGCAGNQPSAEVPAPQSPIEKQPAAATPEAQKPTPVESPIENQQPLGQKINPMDQPSDQPENQQPLGQKINPAPSTQFVSIANFAFNPPAITVKQGTTVTWTNTDQAPHDVLIKNPGNPDIRSVLMKKDQSFSYTFTTSGTYDYICGVHPSMKGTVVVE